MEPLAAGMPSWVRSSPLAAPARSSPARPPPLDSLCGRSFPLCYTTCGMTFFVYFLSPLPPATTGHLARGKCCRRVPKNNRLAISLSSLNLSSPLASSCKPTQWTEAVSAFNCSRPRPVPSCFRVGCEMARNSPSMWSAAQHFRGAARGPPGNQPPGQSCVHLCESPSNWRPVRVLSPPAWPESGPSFSGPQGLLPPPPRHTPSHPRALTPVLPSAAFPQT